MSERRWLLLILALFVLLGATYAIVTPVFEASDELWHYPMVRYLAQGNPLPVQDPLNVGPWKQEASQPPLYYYLAAALTFWIDTSDMEQVRWLNPHVDNGVITADGNTNLAVHDPRLNPWQGTLLAARLIRLASALMGAATVYLTYRIAKEVVPTRPELALGAAALNAFTPMFLFISGAVNNDNLVIPLSSLALLLMIYVVKGKTWPVSQTRKVWQWFILGIVIGLAILTKESALALIPLAWGTFFIAAWEETGRPAALRPLARIFAVSLGRWLVVLVPVLLIAGWWYVRNWVLYGDWLGWNAFLAVLGQRAHPASLAQLWGERWGFLLSYWGLFGGVNVPMWTWIYHLLNGLLLLGLVGFLVYLYKEIRDWRSEIRRAISNLQSLISNLLSSVSDFFPLVICLLWSAAVIFGLIRWATVTWSSQGRLVFTAISALNTLWVLGLAGWLPRRPAKVVVGAVATFLFFVSAAAPFLWIQPAYQPNNATLPAGSQPSGTDFGGVMRLVSYHIEPTEVRPGDYLDVVLEWRALAPMDNDWSVFVHLHDPILELPVAQRDMYPGQGLLPTRLLQAGQQVVNVYRLMVPATAVAPADLQLVAGLYDFETNERLTTGSGQDRLVLADVMLRPRSGEFPNATDVNFENQLELVGYEIPPRRLRPGEPLDVTLYWHALRPLDTNYTFFVQVVAADTTRWASYDLTPQPGTADWPVGDVQTLTMPMTLDPNTPAGVFPIIAGAYTITAGGQFDRLQQLTSEGRLTDDFVALTQVRVDR